MKRKRRSELSCYSVVKRRRAYVGKSSKKNAREKEMLGRHKKKVEIATVKQPIDNPEIKDNGSLHINDLPDSLLLRIFGRLNCFDILRRLRLVCRRWHGLSGDRYIWKYQQVHMPRYMNGKDLVRFANFAVGLAYLDLSNCEKIKASDLVQVLKVTPRLQTLMLPVVGISVNSNVFDVISTNCTLLRNLLMASRLWDKVGESDIRKLVSCKELSSFVTVECPQVTDSCAIEIFNSCRKIAVVFLQVCGSMTDRTLEGLAASQLNVQCLKIQDQIFTARGLDHIGKLRNLQYLIISDFYEDLDERVLTTIGEGCSNLIYVKLVRVMNEISLPGFTTFCKKQRMLAQLMILMLHTFTDDHLKVIGTCCKNLHSLFLNRCTNISKKGLRYLRPLFNVNLNHLSLPSSDIPKKFVTRLQKDYPRLEVGILDEEAFHVHF